MINPAPIYFFHRRNPSPDLLWVKEKYLRTELNMLSHGIGKSIIKKTCLRGGGFRILNFKDNGYCSQWASPVASNNKSSFRCRPLRCCVVISPWLRCCMTREPQMASWHASNSINLEESPLATRIDMNKQVLLLGCILFVLPDDHYQHISYIPTNTQTKRISAVPRFLWSHSRIA